jgi:hypothetical protein
MGKAIKKAEPFADSALHHYSYHINDLIFILANNQRQRQPYQKPI